MKIKKGLTLIEVLVALAISTILVVSMANLITSFLKFSQTIEVNIKGVSESQKVYMSLNNILKDTDELLYINNPLGPTELIFRTTYESELLPYILIYNNSNKIKIVNFNIDAFGDPTDANTIIDRGFTLNIANGTVIDTGNDIILGKENYTVSYKEGVQLYAPFVKLAKPSAMVVDDDNNNNILVGSIYEGALYEIDTTYNSLSVKNSDFKIDYADQQLPYIDTDRNIAWFNITTKIDSIKDLNSLYESDALQSFDIEKIAVDSANVFLFKYKVQGRNMEDVVVMDNIIELIDENYPMILVFDTSLSEGTTITLPLRGTVDAHVDWGDGSEIQNITTSGDHYHTYTLDGEYIVRINGKVDHFGQLTWNIYTENIEKLTKVISFGNIELTSLQGAFKKADNLQYLPRYLPNSVVNLIACFRDHISELHPYIENWDVSNVTNIGGMFRNAVNFNLNLSDWDTSKVTNMQDLFRNTAFNHDISNWNIEQVTNMHAMFYQASNFNQDIGAWNTSNVTRMDYMFYQALNFNQDISNWDTSNVINMRDMFNLASNFNQDLSNWKLNSNLTALNRIFRSSDMSKENYNKILISFANQVYENNGPHNIDMTGQLGRLYGDTNYSEFNSGQFQDAVSARGYLVNIANWDITGDNLN